MVDGRRDRLLTSLLWGAVAAVGEHTMLFLAVIRRIHVRFENEAPVFYVDPRGPIALSKDSALSIVWLASIAFGVAVFLLMYFRLRVSRTATTAIAGAILLLAAVAALAEPLWGLAVLADAAVVYLILASSALQDLGDEPAHHGAEDSAPEH